VDGYDRSFTDESDDAVVDVLISFSICGEAVDCGDLIRLVRFEDGRKCWSWGRGRWCAVVPSEMGDRGEGALFGRRWRCVGRRPVEEVVVNVVGVWHGRVFCVRVVGM